MEVPGSLEPQAVLIEVSSTPANLVENSPRISLRDNPTGRSIARDVDRIKDELI